MADIADGHYDLGIEELKKAYDILPHPNVLYNIARAYVDQGDLENAVSYYKKYLEGNPKDRDEVAQIVAALEARIRKQQAELLESQHDARPPRRRAVRERRRADRAGRVQAPHRAGSRDPARERAAGGKTPGELAGAGLPEGALKTEEVFEETVVTASKSAQSPLDAPNSTSIITEQDIRLSGITKIPELLRRLAGVDIMETTGSQTEVSLRGFNQRLSNKVLVLVDGRSVYVDLIGATFWATLSIGVEDIERIEVVRGPGSALYGADAFNGVINIITKAPGEGGSGFNVGYGDHNRRTAPCTRAVATRRSPTASPPATTTFRAGAERSPTAAPTLSLDLERPGQSSQRTVPHRRHGDAAARQGRHRRPRRAATPRAPTEILGIGPHQRHLARPVHARATSPLFLQLEAHRGARRSANYLRGNDGDQLGVRSGSRSCPVTST